MATTQYGYRLYPLGGQLKGLKRQQGFALIASVLVVLSLVTLGGIKLAEYSAKKRILDNSESFYHRIIYLRTQIHAFVNDRYLDGWGVNTAAIFPNRLSALEPTYVPSCSTADNDKGFCMKVNQTPWGMIEDADYRVVGVPKSDGSGIAYYRAEFDITLPDKTNVALKFERQTTLAMLAQVPNVFYDDTNNKLTVRVDRPDKAFAYESLVKRSGDDSTLLGDWDVGGNFAITNTKEVTIRNDDGSQMRISNKLTDIYTVKHGDWLDKPQCPNGLAPVLTPTVTSIDPHKDYDLMGGVKTYLLAETPERWQLGLDALGVHKNTSEKRFLHEGVITALIQCK